MKDEKKVFLGLDLSTLHGTRYLVLGTWYLILGRVLSSVLIVQCWQWFHWCSGLTYIVRVASLIQHPVAR